MSNVNEVELPCDTVIVDGEIEPPSLMLAFTVYDGIGVGLGESLEPPPEPPQAKRIEEIEVTIIFFKIFPYYFFILENYPFID